MTERMNQYDSISLFNPITEIEKLRGFSDRKNQVKRKPGHRVFFPFHLIPESYFLVN